MATAAFFRNFLLLFSGPLIWSAHFLAIYGWTAVLCARPEWAAHDLVPWGVALASAVALVLIAAICLRAWARRNEREEYRTFIRLGAASLGLLSALAILWEALPAFLVPACG